MLFLLVLCLLGNTHGVITVEEDYGGSQAAGFPLVISLAYPCLINTIHVCASDDDTTPINNCEAQFLVHTWVDTQHYELLPGWRVSIPSSVAVQFWTAKQLDVIISALLANDTDVGYTHIVHVNPLAPLAQQQRKPAPASESADASELHPHVSPTSGGSSTGVIIGTGVAGVFIALITIAIVIMRGKQAKTRHIIHADEEEEEDIFTSGRDPSDLQRLLRMGTGATPAFLANMGNTQ